MQIIILSILKRVSFESLAGMTFLNGARKRRLTAKETSIANCEVLDEKYRIAVQGIFSVLLDWLFAFAFSKNKPGKLVSSLVGCLLLFLKIYVLKIGGNCRGKY